MKESGNALEGIWSLCGVLVRTFSYKSAGLGSILTLVAGAQPTQLFILPVELVNKWVPGEGKPRRHPCRVSRSSRFLHSEMDEH